MAGQGEYVLLITDRDLNVLGNPIVDWTSLDVTLRFNEPSSGLFTAPGTIGLREQLQDGARIIVIRYQADYPDEPGRVVICGPYEHFLYERSDDGGNAGDGMVTVNFADDLSIVVSRLTYPDPTIWPEGQSLDNWVFTGNAEVGLRTLVDYSAGPNALAVRQMPYLALGAVAGVGDNISTTAERMEPLGAVARRMAISGGGLGFRTVQSGSQILFEVYQPEDKSSEVRFSFSLGNVKYLGYEVNAPTGTFAVVGGQGEGSDRFMISRVVEAEYTWGRREILVPRAGSAAIEELNQAGDEALAAVAPTARLASNVADTPTQRFGTHYNLGDLVAVESWPGEQLVDVVRTVHIQATATAGDYISASIGSQAASSDPLWIQRLKTIDSRVGRLERNVLPIAPP